ncbi:MAG: tRNA (guanine(10)-N(2))-dimethyltransferase [Methanomicrobiales archaeon]|nr:tRNA (guanine(10)-N(2))-dimethyltransferase [Methanomicrobiales archaeon]
MECDRIREGRTVVLVPRQDTLSQFPPGTARVFYNPRAALSRDATVVLLRQLRPQEYLDTMGATGIRGLRAAVEAGVPTIINDRDPVAAALIRENIALAGVPVTALEADANVLLSGCRFEAVDLDPFGTPAPYLDSACRSAKRYLFATATDTAPLCGAHRKAGMRRYSVHLVKTEYHSEVGLRTLLGFAARSLARYDRGMEPLLCLAHQHFHRVHLRLLAGAAKADATLGRVGFVSHCLKCLYREEHSGLAPSCGPCPRCGATLSPIGPLWLGPINDPATLDGISSLLPDTTLAESPALTRLVRLLREELPTSTHYDYHVVARNLRGSPPAMETVLQRLEEAGFQASRAHYSGTALKTDAPVEIVEQAIRGE